MARRLTKKDWDTILDALHLYEATPLGGDIDVDEDDEDAVADHYKRVAQAIAKARERL